MDPTRFDAFTKSLGHARSRRSVLRTLGGAALGALGLAGASRADAAPGGNSACDAFCDQVFGNTKAAGQCTSDAAHGRGLCYQCGPAAPSNNGRKLCGQTCIAATECCGGCAAPQTCGGGGTPGQCGCTPAKSCPAGQTCGTAPDGCGGTLQCGSCTGGTVCSPVSCQNGQCVHTPIAGCCASNADCADTNACTTDTCDPSTNTCQHTAITCQPSDACHTASCDPVRGCVQAPVLDGTACDDGNACTQTDTCQSGSCVGGNPVVCTASDQCHAAGTCDPGTGICSNPVLPDGTVCTPSAGVSGTCQNGICVASCTANGDTCAQPSDCCSGICQGGTCYATLAGTCSPGADICSNYGPSNECAGGECFCVQVGGETQCVGAFCLPSCAACPDAFVCIGPCAACPSPQILCIEPCYTG